MEERMEDRWNREEDDSDGIEDVRDALRDYYGTAMVSGFPMAGMDLARVDSMSGYSSKVIIC